MSQGGMVYADTYSNSGEVQYFYSPSHYPDTGYYNYANDCRDGRCYYECRNECSLGDHQCSGTTGRSCERFGSGDCALWSNYQSCDSECYYCGDGDCDSTCGESQSSCPRDCGYGSDQNDFNHYDNYDNRNHTRPVRSDCGRAPNVFAGNDKELDYGGSVRLDGSVDGDYDEISWSCNGGRLSDDNVLDPTFYVSDSYDYGGYDRTYTCTMRARNDCDSDSDSVTIRVRGYDRSPSNMAVALVAEPRTSCAPVNGVDLTATISNYSGGYRNYSYEFTYYFDCENDGDWDKTVTTEDASYTAYNLCNYPNYGSYTARVRVESRGRTVTDTDIVKTNDCGHDYGYGYIPPRTYPVYSYPAPAAPADTGRVNIRKWVKNVTGNTQYQASVTANPSDVLSYKIILTGVSDYSGGITVRDSLPPLVGGARDLRIDGNSDNGNLESGINIGALRKGETKIITFTATLAAENNFTYGQTAMTNAAQIYVGAQSASARATVYVYRRAVAGATSVSTGFSDNVFAVTAIFVAAAVFLAAWIFRGRLVRGLARDRGARLTSQV